MPVCFAALGEENIIRRIGGSPEVRGHLGNLGFVVGGFITVVARMGDNLIVNVKDSRVAISSETAKKIFI